jgi:hypothetical protein
MLGQHDASLGELPVLHRPIEQPLAEILLEPPDRLADRRLRTIGSRRRLGEASAVGDREEDLELV